MKINSVDLEEAIERFKDYILNPKGTWACGDCGRENLLDDIRCHGDWCNRDMIMCQVVGLLQDSHPKLSARLEKIRREWFDNR